nr:MAG TPA: hypothetical protein [Caudoviricetes sp.]
MTIKNSLKKLCKDLTGVESKGSTIREVIDDIEANGTSIYKIDCTASGSQLVLTESSKTKLDEIATKITAGKNVLVTINCVEFICVATAYIDNSFKAYAITNGTTELIISMVTVAKDNGGEWQIKTEQKEVATTE